MSQLGIKRSRPGPGEKASRAIQDCPVLVGLAATVVGVTILPTVGATIGVMVEVTVGSFVGATVGAAISVADD